MKIQGNITNQYTPRTDKMHSNKPNKEAINAEATEKQQEKQQNIPKEEAIQYEKDTSVPNAGTYNKPGHVYDSQMVEKLKKQADDAHASLRKLVEDLLLRQGHSLDILKKEDLSDVKIEVDDIARAEAQAMIADDGPLGVEAVSERIVAFAKAISGGDIEKLDKIKNAIEKGFKEAERILGELPDISRRTFDSVMEKLDAWEKEVKG